jgi:membrane protein
MGGANRSYPRDGRVSSVARLGNRLTAFVRLWVDLFARHQILNSASAISFQALKSLVPLALFGIAALGTVGLSDVWTKGLRQSFARQLTPTAFTAIETAVEKIFADGSPALPFFAGVLLLWYVSGLVRACMGGMNLIYETREQRSFRRRWGISLALAVGVAVAIVTSILVVTAGPRLARSGYLHAVLLIVRWPLAALLLGFAVGLLAHYGAAERRQLRWTSVGSAVIVAAWLVESLLFSLYVRGPANFKSASGGLIVFLVLAAYLYTASIIFLVGIQIDELLRKDASPHERGIIDLLRRGRGTSR